MDLSSFQYAVHKTPSTLKSKWYESCPLVCQTSLLKLIAKVYFSFSLNGFGKVWALWKSWKRQPNGLYCPLIHIGVCPEISEHKPDYDGLCIISSYW
jgi:hypothetical protein